MRRKKFIENFCNFNTIIDLHRTFQENLYEDLVHCCRQNITIVRSNLNLIHIQNILEYIDFNRLKRCGGYGPPMSERSVATWRPLPSLCVLGMLYTITRYRDTTVCAGSEENRGQIIWQTRHLIC